MAGLALAIHVITFLQALTLATSEGLFVIPILLFVYIWYTVSMFKLSSQLHNVHGAKGADICFFFDLNILKKLPI